jgi:hypothetical protein
MFTTLACVCVRNKKAQVFRSLLKSQHLPLSERQPVLQVQSLLQFPVSIVDYLHKNVW